MLSFNAAIFVSASACFLRSISMTLAGALLTNFSLLSFFLFVYMKVYFVKYCILSTMY